MSAAALSNNCRKAVNQQPDLVCSGVKLVDTVRKKLGKKPKSNLHFKTLKHEQRVPYVAEIVEARVRG